MKDVARVLRISPQVQAEMSREVRGENLFIVLHFFTLFKCHYEHNEPLYCIDIVNMKKKLFSLASNIRASNVLL